MNTTDTFFFKNLYTFYFFLNLLYIYYLLSWKSKRLDGGIYISILRFTVHILSIIFKKQKKDEIRLKKKITNRVSEQKKK